MASLDAPPRRGSAATFAATTSDAPPRASAVTAAWTAMPGVALDGGEIIHLAIKPSMWRPLLDSVSWLVIGLAAAGTVLWLGRPIPELSLTATAQVILLVPFVRLALAIMRWIPTWYVLTNRRVIDIQGIRTPRIGSCLLVEIRNTYLHATPSEQLTRLGTITFVTDQSDRPSHAWQSISRPEEIHAKIRRAIESALDRHGAIP